MSNTTWDRETIIALLDRSNTAVERAVVAIYHRQTDDEQEAGTTKHDNGRGFSAFHAEVGSYYARWIIAGRHLSGVHLEKARRIAKRYVGQLAEVAQASKAGQLQVA